MLPVIHILGHEYGTYALCGILGIILAVFVFWKLAKKNGVPFDDVIIIALVSAGGMFAGSHLLYAATNLNLTIASFKALFSGEDFSHLLSLFSASFGGAVFYGGFFGGYLALAIYLKNKKEKKLLKDLFILVVPLFHCFGRIGCFLGGCCYGIESKFGFIAKYNEFVPELCGVRRFPVALLESFLNLIIFLLLLFVHKKKYQSGKLIYVYGILYSLVRFFDEFLRGDAIRGIYFGLSTSQWISVLFFSFSLFALAKQRLAKRKN